MVSSLYVRVVCYALADYIRDDGLLIGRSGLLARAYRIDYGVLGQYYGSVVRHYSGLLYLVSRFDSYHRRVSCLAWGYLGLFTSGYYFRLYYSHYRLTNYCLGVFYLYSFSIGHYVRLASHSLCYFRSTTRLTRFHNAYYRLLFATGVDYRSIDRYVYSIYVVLRTFSCFVSAVRVLYRTSIRFSVTSGMLLGYVVRDVHAFYVTISAIYGYSNSIYGYIESACWLGYYVFRFVWEALRQVGVCSVVGVGIVGGVNGYRYGYKERYRVYRVDFRTRAFQSYRVFYFTFIRVRAFFRTERSRSSCSVLTSVEGGFSIVGHGVTGYFVQGSRSHRRSG